MRKIKEVRVMDSLVNVTEKEVDFSDIELSITKPSVNKDGTISAMGNFTELEEKINALVERYKDTELTDENVKYVSTLKSHFVSLRTGIDLERKSWKKAYIDPVSKLIDTRCNELLSVVAKGESALKLQLDAYDQRRKDELTLVLQDYAAESASKHNLREEYAVKIELKDKYFNKTQKEEDSADDIELQAQRLEKEQKDYDSSVAFIKAECEGTSFVPETYIRELQYKSAMEIILEIKADKKSAEEMKAKIGNGEKVVIGESIADEIKKAMSFDETEDDYRERVLRVRYLPSQAKLMADFFKQNNIEFEFIKK